MTPICPTCGCYDGQTVHLCRCPGCQAAFRADADALLARLAA
jgi:hypothetical protein